MIIDTTSPYHVITALSAGIQQDTAHRKFICADVVDRKLSPECSDEPTKMLGDGLIGALTRRHVHQLVDSSDNLNTPAAVTPNSSTSTQFVFDVLDDDSVTAAVGGASPRHLTGMTSRLVTSVSLQYLHKVLALPAHFELCVAVCLAGFCPDRLQDISKSHL